MSNVFPRNCKANLPLAVRGDGVYIVDSTGKRYLDASGGAAVSCLGHSNTRVIEAIKAQLEQLAFAHTGFFSSEPAEALAALLNNNAPGALDRVYVVSGGSEAVEAAIKHALMAWAWTRRATSVPSPRPTRSASTRRRLRSFRPPPRTQ